MPDIELNVEGNAEGGLNTLKALEAALDIVAKALQQVEVAQERVTVAQQKLNAAQASGNTQRVSSAMGVLTRANTALAAAQARSNAASNLQTQILNRMGTAHSQAAQQVQKNTRSLQLQQIAVSGLAGEVRSLLVQFAGFKLISGFVEKGIEFNRVIETAALGIGTLIAAQSDLIKSDGKVATGAEAIDISIGLAKEQVDKLRVAGLQTAATTVQLVDAFEQAVGVGLRVGLTLDQIRKFTVQVVQASSALGVRMDQINQEVRSILDGTIDRNSRVAKALQLSNQQIRQAREQNRLAELLNERLGAFTAAGEKAVDTFTVLRGNIADAVSVFAGAATKPLFDNIKEAALTALKSVFDFTSADVSGSFRGLVETGKILSQEIGTALAAGIRTVVELAKELSDWLVLHRAEVQQVSEAFGTLIREIGNVVLQFILVIAKTVAWATETGVLQLLLNDIATIARVIAENMDIVLGLVVAISAISLANPFTLALAAAGLLLGLLIDVNTQEKQNQALRLRRIQDTARETGEVVRLGAEYQHLAKAVEQNKLQGQDLVNAQTRMRELLKQLSILAPELRGHLEDEKRSVKDLADEVRNLTLRRVQDLQIQITAAQARKAQLQQALVDQEQSTHQFVSDQGVGRPARPIASPEQIEKTKADIRQVNNEINALLDAAIKAADAIDEAQKAADVIIKAHPLPPLKGELDNEAQIAQGRLKLIKQANRVAQEALDQGHDAQLISEELFLQSMANLQKREVEAEKDVVRAKLKAAQDKGLQGQLIEQLKALDEKIIAIDADTTQKLEKFHRDFANTRREFVQRAFAETGDELIVSAQQIAEKYRKALLDAFREGDFALVNIINEVITREIAQKGFDILKRQFNQVDRDISDGLANIEGQLANGQIGELLANQLKADVIIKARDRLQELVDMLEKLKPLLGNNPEFLEFLDNAKVKIDNLTASVQHVNDTLFEVGQTLKREFVDQFQSAIGDLTDGSKSVGEAFRDMARSIVRSLNEVIAKMIALKIVEAAIGIFSPGLPAAPAIPGIGPGDIPEIATGGWISGPGDGTRDTVLAMLANREFVVNARSAVANRDLLEFINRARGPVAIRNLWRNQVPGYAQGGEVRAPQSINLAGELGIHLDDGIMADRMESFMRSPRGEEIFVRVYGRTKSRRKGIS